MDKLELYYPVKPWSINQGFGNVSPVYTNLGMKGHNGIDAYAPDSTIVRAAHDGTVTYAGEDGSNGLLVVIRTDTAFEYNGGSSFFKTLYGHLRKDGITVKASQQVTVGQVIALSDNTGLSTGSHLHFGLKPVLAGEADWQWFNTEQDNGYNGAIDPTPYFVGICAENASVWIKIKSLVPSLLIRVKILAELVKLSIKK